MFATKSGPSSARQLKRLSAQHLTACDFLKGTGTVLLRNPIALRFSNVKTQPHDTRFRGLYHGFMRNII